MRKIDKIKQYVFPYLLILPSMVGIGLFVVYPIIKVIILSFYSTNMINPAKTKYVGFENYIKMFNKVMFKKAMVNTSIYTLVMIVVVLALSLLLAVWLGQKSSRINYICQMAVFLPHIISIVSVALIFVQMMEPNFGLFNSILVALNLPTSRWLQSSDTALMSVLLVSIWKSVGYYTLIFIAALQSVPRDIYEAAELDNAGKFKTFYKITLPMISPQIFFVVIVLTIGSFKVIETIRLMTNGGPNNATTSLVFYIYREVFNNTDIGKGAAAGVVLMVIVGIMTVLYFSSLSKRVHYR